MPETPDQSYLTPEGEHRLKTELEQLEGPRRRELSERLRFAIKQGDLSENADYITAKEEQAFLEGRIAEIKAILRQAEIIEAPAQTDKVVIGSTVMVQEDGRPSETYRVVGAPEANPRNGLISNVSPIGRALLGLAVGEIAVAKTPGGELRMKILEIK